MHYLGHWWWQHGQNVCVLRFKFLCDQASYPVLRQVLFYIFFLQKHPVTLDLSDETDLKPVSYKQINVVYLWCIEGIEL